jgi:hypothetical protein
MDLDQFPLSMFEVDCDGSACGSGPRFGRHIHPCQTGGEPICRVRIVNGERVEYLDGGDS